MFRIAVVTQNSRNVDGVIQSLSQRGYACSLINDDEDVVGRLAEKVPDLVLIENLSRERIFELSHDIRQGIKLPIVVVVGRDLLSGMNGHLIEVDDFVIEPVDALELELRVRRLLRRGKTSDSSEQMACGDLTIDLAKCEVTVGGRPVVLTFKEYELLKYLVGNQGRVCTREALLDRVWGYEYYGGDRTVDVHIRRLRSKIEDATHTFVETVRNIGYRFRAEG